MKTEIGSIDLINKLIYAIKDIFKYNTPSKAFFINILLFLIYVLLLLIIKKRKIIFSWFKRLYRWVIEGWKVNLRPQKPKERIKL